MKKLYAILFVACALYTIPAFAKDYVVKYNNETGEVIAWGAMSGLNTDPGESVMTTNTKIDSVRNYIVKGGSLVEKNSDEKKEDADKIKDQKKARKDRKAATLSKMGLNQSDISALKDLVQDGSLD